MTETCVHQARDGPFDHLKGVPTDHFMVHDVALFSPLWKVEGAGNDEDLTACMRQLLYKALKACPVVPEAHRCDRHTLKVISLPSRSDARNSI